MKDNSTKVSLGSKIRVPDDDESKRFVEAVDRDRNRLKNDGQESNIASFNLSRGGNIIKDQNVANTTLIAKFLSLPASAKCLVALLFYLLVVALFTLFSTLTGKGRDTSHHYSYTDPYNWQPFPVNITDYKEYGIFKGVETPHELNSHLFVLSKRTHHIVPHTHLDLSWWQNPDANYQRYAQPIYFGMEEFMLRDARAKDKRFLLAEMYFVREHFSQFEGAKGGVREAVASGRVEVVNGAYAMHDTGTSYFDDILTIYTYGRKFSIEQLGVHPSPGLDD
jgi:hypothetical protein